ncbi:MAG: choline dehydrogenase [Marivibrio sp.]|uniref:choline dehydrogenase n=1 Tax=Marivibrio sp. TaxID=2039719 RepID=UPI0032EEF2D2
MAESDPSESFDYVIVGAGTAGSILAARLTEDAGVTVCLLEAGGSDRSIWTRMPAALSIPMNMKRFDWGLYTEPEPHMNGRRVKLPRGKGLGGSSTINGMCYVRGNPLDYEGWVEQGAAGWGYADVLPYFKRAETFAGGADDWRGGDGPLKTRRGTLTNPLCHAFMLAGAQAGYPLSADMNGAQQEGFAPMDMTVHEGERCSLARAYLRPAMRRDALAVKMKAQAERILFDGRRAQAVSYRQGGRRRRASARRAVILCAGAIMSPHLLKLSGVGPASELQAHEVSVVHHSPGVGENLTDHLEVYLQQACVQPVSLSPALSLWGRAAVGIRWLSTRSGLGASNHFEAGAFIRSRAGVRFPDIQYHFLPIAMSSDGKSFHKGHGFQVHVGPKRSKSRGWVRLNGPAPEAPPRVRFNYLSHDSDLEVFRACVRLTREIFAQPAFDPFRGGELSPGPDCVTDDAIDAFVRDKAESAYHPSATCRMGGAKDPRAVVSPELRVHGLEGLFIVDASVMPEATSGDLNAPTAMIAERAADLLRGRPLPREEGARFVATPTWREEQRPGAPLRRV